VGVGVGVDVAAGVVVVVVAAPPGVQVLAVADNLEVVDMVFTEEFFSVLTCV
jgi:hypothetical protein